MVSVRNFSFFFSLNKNSNLPCLAEVMNDLHCNIRIHVDTTREIKAPDRIHVKRIAQTDVKHRLILKCLPLRNAKFMMLLFDRFELDFSSRISCIPLAFLKNTSVVSAGRKFDDINDDSVYKRFGERRVCLIIYINNKTATPLQNKHRLFVVLPPPLETYLKRSDILAT